MKMIDLKTPKEIEVMKEGGMILAKILRELQIKVIPGITTRELNKFAEELILKYGAKPSFLNYDGFPAVLCTSLNEEIVHGVPSERKVEEGDLLKLDLGVLYKGFHTDSAITVMASERSKLSHIFKKQYARRLKLISITRRSLEVGISKACVGSTIEDIGAAIQVYVEGERLNVVRDLVGHGIGRQIHEEPQVPNYGKPRQGLELVEGMVIAIEPMVVTGDWRIKEGEDGFVFETRDGGLAAHFEHTVAITAKGPFTLTN